MDMQKLGQAMRSTWDTIGGDILECNDGKSMLRDEVIEVVLDANYLEMYGRDAIEDIKEFRKLPYTEQDKLAKTVFTYRSYGY